MENSCIGDLVRYSGTSIENYRTCAYVHSDGNVYFDKSREPRHHEPQFCFSNEFFMAFIFTGKGYYDLETDTYQDHTPLIMEGVLPKHFKQPSLPPSIPFRVTRGWLRREDINWKTIFHFDKDLQDYHYPIDPKALFQIE